MSDVVSTYTAEQAIEDGIFVDVTETAKEAGIKYPVAVTRNLWDTHIVPSKHCKRMGQSTHTLQPGISKISRLHQ